MIVKKLLVAIIATTLLLGSIACGGGGRPLSELESGQGSEKQTYLIKEGDVVMVNVWGEPKVSGEFTVRSDGRFNMPLAKQVRAKDLTLEQLEQVVTKKLRKFIPAASVSASLVRAAPIKYFLSGSFMKPGPYLSTSSITFLQAISTGGGFAPFADESSITLIRQTVEGEFRYKLDYNRVLDGKDPNPILKNGDVIAIR